VAAPRKYKKVFKQRKEEGGVPVGILLRIAGGANKLAWR